MLGDSPPVEAPRLDDDGLRHCGRVDMHYRVEIIAMGDWDDTDNFTSYAVIPKSSHSALVDLNPQWLTMV